MKKSRIHSPLGKQVTFHELSLFNNSMISQQTNVSNTHKHTYSEFLFVFPSIFHSSRSRVSNPHGTLKLLQSKSNPGFTTICTCQKMGQMLRSYCTATTMLAELPALIKVHCALKSKSHIDRKVKAKEVPGRLLHFSKSLLIV